jgi:glycine/D-amino acid oxidase-like deaminating enzyme
VSSLSRRDFFAAMGVLALGSGSELLPTPDFSRVKRYIAGIRPYRRGRFRLEEDRLGDKVLLHNYGHGGAGVTLSWGCAEEVVEMLRESTPPPAEVAVLGAGIMGMSTAMVLIEHGYRVKIYTEKFTPDTTSDVAGAQWSPALVNRGPKERFVRIMRASHRRFARLAKQDYGVTLKANYATNGRASHLGQIPDGLLSPVERLSRLPFAGPAKAGRLYHTFHIEPPIYMPTLLADCYYRGVETEERRFEDSRELVALPEKAIVNCLGYGARRVFGDDRLQPIRGQLVLLEPQRLPYMLSHAGYIFPRKDGVVLGGSTERGVFVAETDERTCRGIIRKNARFFGL